MPCDKKRLLYKQLPSNDVQVICYDCFETYYLGDNGHKFFGVACDGEKGWQIVGPSWPSQKL